MSTRANRPSVLCVDDDPELLDGLALVLRSRFQVLPAQGAEEAMAVLATRPVDVILCDVGLPGMRGPDLLAVARNLAPEATRLLLTGDLSHLHEEPGLEAAGVHRALEKPVSADLLVQTLQEAAALAAARRREAAAGAA